MGERGKERKGRGGRERGGEREAKRERGRDREGFAPITMQLERGLESPLYPSLPPTPSPLFSPLSSISHVPPHFSNRGMEPCQFTSGMASYIPNLFKEVWHSMVEILY